MIRRIAFTLVMSAAVLAPASRTTTSTRHTVRDSKAAHLTAVSHTVARSGYIIASS